MVENEMSPIFLELGKALFICQSLEVNLPAVPALPGTPVNSWFPDKLFANFLGYSKRHAAVNS